MNFNTSPEMVRYFLIKKLQEEIVWKKAIKLTNILLELSQSFIYFRDNDSARTSKFIEVLFCKLCTSEIP